MDLYYSDEFDPVLQTVCAQWMTKIRQAIAHKRTAFQDKADEALAFFAGPRDWNELMGSHAGLERREGDVPDPVFKISVNKTFEFVTIFGPALYYENPVRTVRPRVPPPIPPDVWPDPMLFNALAQQEQIATLADKIRSVVLESYLNWSPVEFGLSEQSRLAIDEALIKGRGCLWTELFTPPGANFKVVRSMYETTDDLLIDPDARSLDQAIWIARRCVHPVWQVERDYGLRRGSLRGSSESMGTSALIDSDAFGGSLYDRRRGYTNDLLTYWKIYSKMGIGGRMSTFNRDWSESLEVFGDYCYIVVADSVPFPLNLPPEVQGTKEAAINVPEIMGRVAWPTPYWADNEWPVTTLDFHTQPNTPWPLPHITAGIGELKFINWCYSFLAGKVKNTCRDFLAVLKGAGEEMKERILSGEDLTLLEIDSDHKVINEVVQTLQFPTVNGDIWRMIEAVERNFDKRVGLTELMYGGPGITQPRSAEEVSVRNQNMNVRPDDMAKKVEGWMANVAAKEALCARYHLIPQDIGPILGTMAAIAWQNYIQSKDLSVVVRQLDYRIEAGSTRKPNKEREVQQMTEAFQSIGPILQNFAQATGNLQPLNNLLADWAKSRDLDPTRYQLAPLPPPPAPPGPAGPPGPPPAQNGAPASGPPAAARNGAGAPAGR